MSFLDRFFGKPYDADLKAAKPLVKKINELEPASENATDAELAGRTLSFKKRLQNGETLDELLPEAFATVRETTKRTLGQRHFDVQLIGGIVLHTGKINEMRTGEGKTQTAALAAYLNALPEKGVHVVTVNDYLARRDAVWMGQIYHALGLTVGIINQDDSYVYDPSATTVRDDAERDVDAPHKIHYEFLKPCTRTEAYAADITYGTNNQFGFDYLRDNITFDAKDVRQRGHAYAIIDEIDSILIDEARVPLIISMPAEQTENLYDTFQKIASRLKPEEHFEVDEKLKAITLTDAGIEMAESMLGIDNIYTDRGIKHVHHLETAVRAGALYTKDKEYVVRDGQVVIVDEFTGRMQPGRRWGDGLHQALEAKEGVAIQKESRTYASITFQNYFRMYDKLSGMTGTALTSQEEFYSVYGLDVVPLPTNKEVERQDHNDQIYQTTEGKAEAIVQKIKAVQETGQPVLVGTASIEANEALHTALTKAGVVHEMLNAKNHEREGEIVADAGRKGRVTLATNMAGRGVDIKLGGADATESEREEIKNLGGLFVLGTERHEARRIDNQLRGRSGRQGDPGTTQFFVSMEDTLMRVFGGDRIKNMMGTLGIPADQPIENGFITKQLEGAQKKIEGFHFDSRKQVLAYDDVLNQQRQTLYARRRKLLMGGEGEVDAVLDELIAFDPAVASVIMEKKDLFGEETFRELMRRLTLQITDTLWVEHLEVMEYTRQSVTLRAYGQRDPLIEYRKEGTRLFTEMQDAALHRLVTIIPNMQPEAIKKEDEEMKQKAAAAKIAGGSETASTGKPKVAKTRVSEALPGRNDLVKISKDGETREMKYKKAEKLLQEGWTLV